MLKKIFLIIAILLIVLLLAFVIFYFWGSSGNLPNDKLTGIKEYNQEKTTSNFEQKTYRVMTYNIGYFSGMTNNQSVKPGRELFKKNMNTAVEKFKELNLDFVAYQEIDFKSKRSYFINQLDELATQTGFEFSSYAINWDKNYVPFPYLPLNIHFGKMLSGQAIMSKFPIIDNERILLQKSKNNPFYYNAFYLDRLIQISTINMKNFELIIMNVHLEAFEKETREKQCETILKLYNKYKEYPMLIIGDFNTCPPNANKKKNFEHDTESNYENELTIKRILNETDLAEAFPIEGDIDYEKEKQYFTYSSRYPESKIDYIFYTPDTIELIDSYRVDSLGETSDHLPLLMEFTFKEVQ